MKKNYPKGLLYFIISLLVSCGNDAITKYAGHAGISLWQITFSRLGLGVIWLIIYGLLIGDLQARVRYPSRHLLRGGSLALATTLWTYSLSEVHLTTATMMSFTIPLFTLLLSPTFLGEKVSWRLWLPTLLGIMGIVVLLHPFSYPLRLHSPPLPLLVAVVLFAWLDVLHKKYVAEESIFAIIFYATLVAALLTAHPAYRHWVSLTYGQMIALIGLGLGGNLIIYTLLKAYAESDLVALAPVRYLELPISTALSYLLFQQAPTLHHLLGGLIIIPSVFFIIYHQHQEGDEKGASA